MGGRVADALPDHGPDENRPPGLAQFDLYDFLRLYQRLRQLGEARDRRFDREVRTITITDDEAVLLTRYIISEARARGYMN